MFLNPLRWRKLWKEKGIRKLIYIMPKDEISLSRKLITVGFREGRRGLRSTGRVTWPCYSHTKLVFTNSEIGSPTKALYSSGIFSFIFYSFWGNFFDDMKIKMKKCQHYMNVCDNSCYHRFLYNYCEEEMR